MTINNQIEMPMLLKISFNKLIEEYEVMAKSKDNIATVQITNTGQFLITIPRAIGTALELDKGIRYDKTSNSKPNFAFS